MIGTRLFRAGVRLAISGAVITLGASPAIACGGLVGENGTISLVRTTTLAAYHHGVERYVTSFEFTGQGKEVGSIVPLPAVPTKVERGGDWTLQRLEREVAPPQRDEAFAATSSKASSGVSIVLQTKIDALDITVLKGGGKAVGKWAVDHGFLLTPDAPEVLDYYAARSPVFMAARFNAQRAQTLGQRTGDGTPILVTIPTDRPWVPLRILGLGLGKAKAVDADVFLLTDTKPKMLAGGPGLSLARNEAASASLLTDLRTDKHMGWIPQQMWFTYLKLHATAGQLHYDLAVSAKPGALPNLRDAGVDAAHAIPVHATPRRIVWPWFVGGVASIITFFVLFGRRHNRPVLALRP